MEVQVDERMMSLFSLIAEQARDRKDLFEREEAIMQALLNTGCRLDEADAALSLMQSLAQERLDAVSGQYDGPSWMRAMSRQERMRFSPEAFGFLSRLVRVGVLSEDQREEIIERAMTVYQGRIDLPEIKAMTASVFYAPENEMPASRTAVWN